MWQTLVFGVIEQQGGRYFNTAARLKHLASQEALTWLTTFAGMLTEAGLTGVLRAAPPTRRP